MVPLLNREDFIHIWINDGKTRNAYDFESLRAECQQASRLAALFGQSVENKCMEICIRISNFKWRCLFPAPLNGCPLGDSHTRPVSFRQRFQFHLEWMSMATWIWRLAWEGHAHTLPPLTSAEHTFTKPNSMEISLIRKLILIFQCSKFFHGLMCKFG